MESSLLVSDARDAILIDVTRDIAAQAPDRVDLVLLTHAHRDACGGIVTFDRLRADPVPVLAARSTVRTLRARFRRLAWVELTAVSSGSSLAWRGWRITPLAVPHARDCTTFAWRLAHGAASIVYASDVARLTPALRALSAGCDLLVLDGATWRRRIFTQIVKLPPDASLDDAVSLMRQHAIRRVPVGAPRGSRATRTPASRRP